jgi:hypothetical protein
MRRRVLVRSMSIVFATPDVGPVFISYSSEDFELAQRFCRSLEQHGVGCWMAPRDIRAGQSYAAAIVAAIDAAEAFLLLLTAASNESKHVLRELELAQASECRVLPVVVGGVSPSRRIAFLIATQQWTFAPGADLDGVDGVVAGLLQSGLGGSWSSANGTTTP